MSPCAEGPLRSHGAPLRSATGKWGDGQLPLELDEEVHQAHVIIIMLKSRVRDTAIRQMTDAFQSQAGLMILAKSEKESKETSADMVTFASVRVKNQPGGLWQETL